MGLGLTRCPLGDVALIYCVTWEYNLKTQIVNISSEVAFMWTAPGLGWLWVNIGLILSDTKVHNVTTILTWRDEFRMLKWLINNEVTPSLLTKIKLTWSYLCDFYYLCIYICLTVFFTTALAAHGSMLPATFLWWPTQAEHPQEWLRPAHQFLAGTRGPLDDLDPRRTCCGSAKWLNELTVYLIRLCDKELCATPMSGACFTDII